MPNPEPQPQTTIHKKQSIFNNKVCTIFSYESHNKVGFGIKYLLIKPSGQMIKRVVRLIFLASNNKVEYKVTIFALKVASTSRVKNLVHIFQTCDLPLWWAFEARDDRMNSYLSVSNRVAKIFDKISVTQRPKKELRHVYSLAFIVAPLEVRNLMSIQINI